MIRRRVRAALACALALAAAGFLAPAQSPSTSRTSSVNFSFDQVDIRLLIKLVGDMTGRRFVVDNAVSGKVTVVTPTQIPIEEVYPLFLSILESSGYSVAERENIFHVVPLAQAMSSGAPVMGPDETGVGAGIVTKVIRLSYVSAVDLKKVLEPMVRGGGAGAISAFGDTNHLIITDTWENIARVQRIIAELDKPGASRTVEVVRLKYASAEDIAAELAMAIRGSETPESRLQRRIQQKTEGGVALPTDVVVVPAIQANGVVLVGPAVQIAEMKRVIELIDVESSTGYGRMNAIFLKYLSAEEAAKSLNALLAKTVEKDARQRIAIEPSIANNALIIDASPQDFSLVRELVAELDKVPQQVLVEVLIAEMSLGKQLDLGVEWATIEIPAEGRTTAIGRSRPGETDQIMDLITQGIFPQGLSIGVSDGATVLADGTVQPQIPFLLTALAQNRDVKILSNVPLWAQNNTEASVSVVDNIPILRSTIEGGSGTSRDVIQNIDRMDVGIKLKLTPHVNPDREVLMQLNPSIEAIIDEGPADQPFTPTIAKREVSTTVTVADGATVVISGLIREDRVKAVSKIPILGDIPLLGVLFRTTSDRKQRTNLLIFVTPHIVTDVGAATALRKALEERSALGTAVTNVSLSIPDGK